MSSILLAGIDRRYIPRLKEKVDNLPVGIKGDWNFNILAAGKVPGLMPANVQELLQRAADQGGAHIIGVRALGVLGRKGEEVENSVRQSFRFRWLAEDLGQMLNNQAIFDQVISKILEEESWWRTHVLPTSCHDAQILPKTFKLNSRLVDFHRLVESYNDLDLMKSIEGLLNVFPQLHRAAKGGAKVWIDNAGLSWDDYGAHHGSPPFPQGWKYSYLLPDRFHFDVEHSKGAAFSYRCSSALTHTRKKAEHVNVNAHGFVLGANA
ncbi:hypothetical protein VDR64_18220 [Xanthomonas campestris pv. campestris]|uniref:hypothetical protein n=1 Tax=Xanthomonas sp. MWU16-30325 TaxID=2878096 RepID=UPI001CF8E554|nr:hypothetical protein [Xanthomonas sp. MWU16-30325]MEB1894246.1 hypothetical protein [Xanthomonas campestris pv. campestris]